MSVKLPHSQMSLPLCSLSFRMVAAGSRVTVAAEKSPQGASLSFDEATNLNPLPDDEFSHGATVDRWRAVNAAGRIQPANFTCETAGWNAILNVLAMGYGDRLGINQTNRADDHYAEARTEPQGTQKRGSAMAFPRKAGAVVGIQIGASVGRNGINAPADVLAVGGALVAIGVDNGGVFGPPLSIEGLIEAIMQFQSVQSLLQQPDGRIDPNGNSLRRLNAILFPDEVGISPLAADGLATTVTGPTWAPDESSIVTDLVFSWIGMAGSGTIHYFQLAEQTVPRWFGVLVPDGTTSFDRVHIFFHPTPAQAGHNDADYHGLGSFRNIFHYLSEPMGSQFSGAESGRILIMPLMTQASAADCGTFPQRWVNYVGCILGRLASGLPFGAPFQRVSSVVVSSFSSGIVYSHQFRARSNLGARLAGVIDFDGVISSHSALSTNLTGPAGHVVKAQQSAASASALPGLAAQNIFPLTRERWGGPWTGVFDPNPPTALLQIHGQIPQTMMGLAARRVDR
jgi:hypothetical protein